MSLLPKDLMTDIEVALNVTERVKEMLDGVIRIRENPMMVIPEHQRMDPRLLNGGIASISLVSTSMSIPRQARFVSASMYRM